MIRLVQIALLLAIIIPFGIAVRWGVEGLPEAARWFGAGIPVGMAIMLALNAWDRRQRDGAGRRGD
jgi:hypothetical protein